MAHHWILLFFLTLGAGLAMAAGALFAMVEHVSPRWLENELRHGIIAFGGGILLAAVSLVLIHEGMRNLSPIPVILCFGGGGVLFMFMDMYFTTNHQRVPQLTAMLVDFIPEAIALGALYLLDKKYAFLLAFLIGLQNFPEGFNAYRELRAFTSYSKMRILLVFVAMAFIGPVAGLTGYFFLSEYPELISAIMLIASGGILYLVFQDIAPQARLRKRWAPSLGAVAGFLLGLIGKMILLHVS